MEPTHVAERGRDDLERHARVERVAHPSPRDYVRVAVALAIVTAIEVALFYIEAIPDGLLIVLLLGLSAIKFALVVLWFMHLKFDSRMFRRLFVTGLILAVVVFLIVLLTFGIFI